jgi:FAD/FMN-containing dehydrogenase
MKRVDGAFVHELQCIVGSDRVRSDTRECKLYSKDIGVMPKLVTPFVAAGIAGAVVRPRNETDVVAIVNAAREHQVPIVARGASSSGYGGVLPLPGATVVDMTDLNACISLDEQLESVTVEAGAVWEDVEAWLHRHGYMLCTYPSSAPSSTVAGWLAQGGSGFGAYRYGPVQDTVLSARAVLPTGEVREFSGTELRTYIAEAEGITGIITQVTYRVRKETPLHVRLLWIPDEEALGAALGRIEASSAPIYSLTFLNPTSVRLKKTLPPRTCHAYEEAEEAHTAQLAQEVPDGYLLLVACDQPDAERVDEVLAQAAEEAGGHFLSDEIADHEWEQRFNTMRLKRIGPSIIPTEVVVPRAKLVQTLLDIKRKVHQEFVLEGTITRDDEAVLLGYIPHDERRFAFNVAFALALSVIRIAQGYGGRVYATGV